MAILDTTLKSIEKAEEIQETKVIFQLIQLNYIDIGVDLTIRITESLTMKTKS